MSIKKPSAVESPYVTTNTTPTRLASGPVAGGGVNTVAATVAPTVSANANANADTTSASTGSNVSYYTSGIEGVAGLANYGRVFDGANVYVTLEQPQYVTYNQTFTGSNIGNSISVTGNITTSDGYFIGDGSQLTGISSLGNFIVNGSSKVDVVSPGGNVIVDSRGNVWTFIPNNTLVAPGGSRWTNQANADAYFTSSLNGFVHLQSLFSDGNIGSEVFLEHGLLTLTAHSVGANTDYTWTFNNSGNLGLPAGSNISDAAGQLVIEANAGSTLTLRTTSGNAYTLAYQDSNSWEAYAEDDETGADSAWAWIYAELPTVDTPQVWIENKTGSDGISKRWAFDGAGSLTPPTQASNQRTGTGLTLKIGNENAQAIITGPAPVANSYNDAPRLVVAGQDGVLDGEGGDIYLWAGQSGPDGGSGGDIKVDAGNSFAGSEGGTIKIRGGRSQDTGLNGTGGFVEIDGGRGDFGGPVTITGGLGNSQANSANVTIATEYGGNWTFDNYGNLTLPNGALLKDTAGDSVAFGQNAGATSQAQHAVAIGGSAGQLYQGEDSVAIGYNAGYQNQQRGVAIGYYAGTGGTLYRSVSDAHGGSGPVTTYVSGDGNPRLYVASTTNIDTNQRVFGNNIQTGTYVTAVYPGEDRVDINQIPTNTLTAGDTLTFVSNTIGIDDASNVVYPMRVTGTNIPANTFVQSAGCSVVTLNQYPTAPLTDGASLQFTAGQGAYSTAIGYNAGYSFQNDGAVAVGYSAGRQNQSIRAVSVGEFAGYSNQSANAVAVGASAGEFTQGVNAVAVGYKAGYQTQGNAAVAIGEDAGYDTQGANAIAIGYTAGLSAQGNVAIAIGMNAGRTTQGTAAVAMGWNAGNTNQGNAAVAIGEDAGFTNQGEYSVAIGYQAGYYGQANNSIVLNASGDQINGITANSFTVKPVRNASTGNVLYYDQSTGEITFDAGGGANTGNVTFSDQIVIGTGISNLIGGLYLAPSSSSANAVQYLRVRGDVTYEPTHIHFDTGNNQYFNQFIGDDNKYVLLSNTGNIVINTDDYAGNSAQWTFGIDGNLTIPGNILGGGNILIAPDSASASSYLDIYLTGGPDIHIASNDNSIVIGRDTGANIFVGNDGEVSIQASNGTPQVWNFGTDGTLTLPDGSGVAGGFIYGAPGEGAGVSNGGTGYQQFYAQDDGAYVQTSVGNAGTVFNTWTFGLDGNLTTPGGSGDISGANVVSAVTFSATGNANVLTLTTRNGDSNNSNASPQIIMGYGGTGDYPQFIHTTHNASTPVDNNIEFWTSDGTQAGTFPGNAVLGLTVSNGNIKTGAISATGNVTAANFFGNGNTLSNVATQVTGSWTVPVGNSTQNFTVNSGTYSMWVDCNITNGILVWNATATVTNTNVPVVGYQYAWVYNGGGTPIDFTSIPNQFTGTANAIVRSNTAPSSTTNRFDFGINNTSGGNVTVRYGWTKIS